MTVPSVGPSHVVAPLLGREGKGGAGQLQPGRSSVILSVWLTWRESAGDVSALSRRRTREASPQPWCRRDMTSSDPRGE